MRDLRRDTRANVIIYMTSISLAVPYYTRAYIYTPRRNAMTCRLQAKQTSVETPINIFIGDSAIQVTTLEQCVNLYLGSPPLFSTLDIFALVCMT